MHPIKLLCQLVCYMYIYNVYHLLRNLLPMRSPHPDSVSTKLIVQGLIWHYCAFWALVSG